MLNKEKLLFIDKNKVPSNGPKWIERPLIFDDGLDLLRLSKKCELIIDSASHCIYLYKRKIKLQPQEYAFLKLILGKKQIHYDEIMENLYKIKNKIQRQKENISNKNTKINELGYAKAPYKILSKIRNKIFLAFVTDEMPDFSKNTDNLAKIKLNKKNWIDKNKSHFIKEYNMADYSQFIKNGLYIEINHPDKPTSAITINLKNNFDVLINVSNKMFYTYFRRYRGKNTNKAE